MKKKVKKILYLITFSEWGGAQRYIFDLATHFCQNYSVVVAAGQHKDDLFFKKLKKNNIQVRPLQYLVRPISPFFDFLAFFEILQLIQEEKPQILHLNSSKAGVLGALAAKLIEKFTRKKIKVVFTAHGWVFNEPLPFWQKKLYFWLEKLSAFWKDKIICVSEYDFQIALKTKLTRPEKLTVIHNGIDASQIKFLPSEEAKKELLSRIPLFSPSLWSRPLIGCIAHFYPTKGLKYLIKSAKIVLEKFPQVIFILIGDGSERNHLEELIKKYHLENNFFLIGEIPEAAQYLKAFDLFVLPSLKEGFPYVILEAMSAGLPIIASRVGGVPEMIEDKKNGLLVNPSQEKDLARKITLLLKNPSYRKKLSSQAKFTLEKNFLLSQMFSRTEKAYY